MYGFSEAQFLSLCEAPLHLDGASGAVGGKTVEERKEKCADMKARLLNPKPSPLKTVNHFLSKKLKILFSLDHTSLFKFHQQVVQIPTNIIYGETLDLHWQHQQHPSENFADH